MFFGKNFKPWFLVAEIKRATINETPHLVRTRSIEDQHIGMSRNAWSYIRDGSVSGHQIIRILIRFFCKNEVK